MHAIGAGVLLAEIQQTSNITYRIFDYDRVDKLTGEKRELHNDLAIDAIDFKSYELNIQCEGVMQEMDVKSQVNAAAEPIKRFPKLDNQELVKTSFWFLP